MLSQGQIASAWGHGCYHGTKLAVTLYGGGVVTVRPAIGDAVLALNACLETYGYRTHKADTGGFVCRAKVGSPGEVSNHGRAIAIDINWESNPFGSHLHTNMPRPMVDAICAIRTNNGEQVWNWGGFWDGNKDSMHFEIVCRPSDIATGIRGRSVPVNPPPIVKPTPPPFIPPAATDKETEIVRFLCNNYVGGGTICLWILGDTLKLVPCTGNALAQYSAAGVPSLALTKGETNDVRGAYGVSPVP